MIKEELLKAMNDQLNAELYSSYLYLSMEAYFESEGLKGFANWMHVQVQEEMMHAAKFFDYINERGGRVVLESIDKPPVEWDGPVAVFEHTLKHEQMVTERINKLVDLATDLNDHAAVNFLQWFVAEQVEEESSVGDILRQVRMVDGNPAGLFMLDKEMATRTFTMPADAGDGRQ